MKEHKYIFPLAVQITLPENYRRNNEFQGWMETLQKLGFWGVELNVADPGKADISDIKSFLNDYNLKYL